MKQIRCVLLAFMASFITLVGQNHYIPKEYANRTVCFNHPNGPYTNALLREDFGNGIYPIGRGFAFIEDSVYKITFNKGQKVSNTGAAVQLKIQPAQQYTLQYKIKYDKNFEKGLDGKQFGFDIGVGYDGGRAAEARANGNGGSVRIQFDSHGDSISNQLYVYYCEMTGKYGNNPGRHHYSFTRGAWHTIRLTVTTQSSIKKSDGHIEVWCDGIKKIDVGHIRFVRKAADRLITRLAFESFPGGGGVIPAYNNYVYVKDLQWKQGQ